MDFFFRLVPRRIPVLNEALEGLPSRAADSFRRESPVRGGRLLLRTQLAYESSSVDGETTITKNGR